MKLYTEEHLKIFYHLGKIDGFIGRQDDVNELIKNYPPIELPSDEDIERYLNNHSYEFEHGFKDAIEFMKNKIQGGQL